jgi:hypothetical protein
MKLLEFCGPILLSVNNAFSRRHANDISAASGRRDALNAQPGSSSMSRKVLSRCYRAEFHRQSTGDDRVKIVAQASNLILGTPMHEC